MACLDRILCIGSVHWDVIGRSPAAMPPGSDVPGRITRQPGGVAMNIAMTLRRLGLDPVLLTAIGRDEAGDALLARAARLGLECGFVHRSADLPTDSYMAIEGAGGLVAAIADAGSLEKAGDRILRPLADGRLGSSEAPWSGPVALDGNLTGELLAEIVASPLLAAADLRVAPASPGKAGRLRPFLAARRATLYLNREEAEVLARTRFDDAPAAARALLALGASRVLVTDGARSAADAGPEGIVTATPPRVPVAKVTGAGDAFMAGHIAAERAGAGAASALEGALRAAAVHVSGDVSP